MIIGFGFGDPLTSLLMLLVTSFLSYSIYKKLNNVKGPGWNEEKERERLRTYYYEQRRLALQMKEEFDLSDEEIERRITEQLKK